MKYLLSECKRMPYLIAALPYSIYISRGLIYNSGNSLICKTKKEKALPPKVSLFPCPVLPCKSNVYVGSMGN